MRWRALMIVVVAATAIPANAITTRAGSIGGNALQRGTTLYMAGGKLTAAQAVTVAKEYNIIAEQSNAVSAYVSQMHAANPNLKIVAYVNGSYDTSNSGTQYPSTWYAHDAAGRKVYSTQFHNWLMLPQSPSGWNGQVATLCTEALKQSGYDGCFLDSLGIAPFDKGYVNSPPVDPSTGKVFATTKWIIDTQVTITATQKANPGKLIIANGLGNGQKFAATQPLLTAAGTAMAELWLRVRNWKVTQFDTPAMWLQDVGMLITAAAKHELILTVTKLWISATTAQMNQWHAYTEASFLMGTDGHSYYCFTTSQTESGLSVDTSYDHVAIGEPTAPMKPVGNAYSRTFTNGIAAVNPGGSSVTIQLGSTYVNLAGKSVTSETLTPNTGDIFVK